MVGIKLYWKYIEKAMIFQDDISVPDHTGAPSHHLKYSLRGVKNLGPV